MFTEAISAPLLKLIERLNSIPDMASFYLGGGTALALQLGHRKSEDQSWDEIKERLKDEVRRIAHRIHTELP